jgi:hypothetical protein
MGVLKSDANLVLTIALVKLKQNESSDVLI